MGRPRGSSANGGAGPAGLPTGAQEAERDEEPEGCQLEPEPVEEDLAGQLPEQSPRQ